MAITARRQVNQVMATSENEQMPDIADLNQTAVDGTQPTNAKFSRQKFHTNYYKCGERGHYARECPQSLAAKQIVLSPTQPPHNTCACHTNGYISYANDSNCWPT